MSAVTATKDRGWIIALIPLGTLVLFFVAPMAYMAAVSVFKNDPAAFFKPAFVLDNYAKFFAPFYYSISLRSLVQAGLGAGIVTLLGFFTVLFVSDQSRWLQRFWVILLLALMCISEVIIGFSWLILLSESAGIPKLLETIGLWSDPRSLSPSFGAMMIGLVTLGLSIVALVLFPELANRDRSIEEAALTLGTPPNRIMWNITLPIFAPTLVALTLTMFVYLLGVFVMPTMLGRPSDWTMTVMISDKAMGDANLPLGAALAVAMLLITGVILLLSSIISRRQSA